jgi:hypothetical protein
MSISTVDDIASALANNRKPSRFAKVFPAPKAAGSFVSSWIATGFPGAGGAAAAYNSGSGYACTQATPGAQYYPSSATQAWLARLSVGCNQPGTLILMDRLWCCGGMGFASGTYAVTTPGSLPARITDSGVGVEAWIDTFGTNGAASGTLVLNYLDTTGASKSGTVGAVVSAPQAGQLQPIPLDPSSLGISGVVSAVTNNTWTSGTFGILLAKRILEIPIPFIGAGVNLDWASIGIPQIDNANACLMWAFLNGTANANTIVGTMDLIDK